MAKRKHPVEVNLKESADTFISRNTEYGDAYKKHGKVLMGLFPDGITLNTEEDFNKMSTIFAITGKLARVTHNLSVGHSDSAADMIVFSAMLKELIDEDS